MSDLIRCEGCSFPYGKLVGYRGKLDSPLAIVGEGPGKNEILKNLPFVGPSGALLEEALKQHTDIEPFITNATICFPGTTEKKDQDKVISATHSCHNRLAGELDAYPRQVILALGNAALWSCTDDYGLKITQVRGKVFPSIYAQRGVVAAVHPSFLLRGGGSLRQFLADVDYACRLAKGGDFRRYIIPKFQVIENIDQLRWLANHLRDLPDGTPVAADSETGGYNGFDHLRDHILCTGFCVEPSLVYVIPEGLVPETGILFSNRCRFVWHNGKFDVKFHRAARIDARVDEDTMLLSYALDETGGVHDLEQVGGDLIGVPDWKYMIKPYLEAAKNSNPKGYIVTYADIPKQGGQQVLYDYMARDISTTLQVFTPLRRNVRANPHLERLYTRMLIPMSYYFLRVEENGLEVDLEQVAKNDKRIGAEVQKYEGELNVIAREAGLTEVNPRSPIQLKVLLYDKLGLRINNRVPDSTDEKTLDKLPQVLTVVTLKKHRTVQKSKSTYVDPVPGWINIDGRVHTTYLIHGTRTGRPASRDPNLLNIPRDAHLRGQFRAKDGHIFLEVDENQAELRVLADLSGDPEMMKIYTIPGHAGIHDVVTLDLFGKISDYTKEHFQFMLQKFNVAHLDESDWLKKLYNEQKMKAKNVNFGIVYGITAAGLSDQIEDTPKVAQEYLDKWYKKFPGAKLFLAKCREAVIQGKNLITPFGRTKRFGCVSSLNLQELQNQASNFPMQSIATDIITDTGMKMLPIADKLNVPIVNTVYDSIIYECPNDPILLNDLAAQTITTVAETAKYWGIRKVPMKAEAKIGIRWGNLEDFKVEM